MTRINETDRDVLEQAIYFFSIQELRISVKMLNFHLT